MGGIEKVKSLRKLFSSEIRSVKMELKENEQKLKQIQNSLRKLGEKNIGCKNL